MPGFLQYVCVFGREGRTPEVVGPFAYREEATVIMDAILECGDYSPQDAYLVSCMPEETEDSVAVRRELEEWDAFQASRRSS